MSSEAKKEKEHQTQSGINMFDPLNISESYSEFLEHAMNNPEHFWDAQVEYWQKFSEICQESTKKFMGEEGIRSVIEPDKGDRRFQDSDWQDNTYFDFLKQSYLLTARWMEDQVKKTEGMDKQQKEKLLFTTRLLASALSPTNFAFTNPAVVKRTIESGGENLIKGFENLQKDLINNHGEFKVSTSNQQAFTLGKDIAVTKGSVIYQNELMQLIQYAPLTEKVHKTPLLIIPPWINKYYILDLKPENSLIKYLVEQGHTVFTISWVNADASLAHIDFEDYLSKGILQSLETIEQKTNENTTNVIGYCIGGTLLSGALSYLQSHGQADRISSATFLTTLIDFEEAGDLKLFLGEEQLQFLEKAMKEQGVFSAKQLQQTFTLLRANDLIWSFVVNNYLMGKEPFPFDLLYWNDDPTNIPASMQSFYLRNMYRDNKLKDPAGIELLNTAIDISQIKIPCYFLSTREDHIAPWMTTYEGAKLMSNGGNKNVTFTLAASGHIAGVINPPVKNKYCYWTHNTIEPVAEDWFEQAKQAEGSWWPHWIKWAKTHAGKKVKAREIQNALEAAPGSYVRVRA